MKWGLLLQCYFSPQSFGSSKSIYMGQQVNLDGEVEKLFEEYEIKDAGDIASLPTDFNAADFATIYAANFAKSDVRIHSVVNLIYIWSLGLSSFDNDRRTAGRRWIDLF